MMKLMLLLLAGNVCAAPVIDWKALKLDAPAPAGAGVAKGPAAEIKAQGAGTAVAAKRYNAFDNPTLTLVLNNTGERLGVEFSACDNSRYEEIAPCETFTFNFPALSYVDKAVSLGAEPVAKRRFGALKLEKGWKLDYRIDTKVVDTGFHKVEEHTLSVFLAKTN